MNGASFEDGYFGEFDDVYDVKLLSFGRILQEPGAAYAYYKASLDTLYYETDGDSSNCLRSEITSVVTIILYEYYSYTVQLYNVNNMLYMGGCSPSVEYQIYQGEPIHSTRAYSHAC